MSVRDFTDYAVDLFDLATDTAADVLAPKIEEIKKKVGSKKIPWMSTARSHFGLKEIRGRRHNKKIMQWAKDLGGWIKNFYKNDEIPWCGLFVAHCMQANDIPVTFKNPLGARNWNKFGYKVEPCPGAIMVFSRRGGGHVGFYVSEDDSTYHILGGNQSNSVNITKVKKNRFLGARWPHGYKTLHARNEGRVHKRFSGKISTNEA